MNCAYDQLFIFSLEREKVRKASFWTLNGIFLPNSSPKAKHSSLSSRMKDIADFQKRRVLVFKNGFSSNGAEIVANTLDDVRMSYFSFAKFSFLVKLVLNILLALFEKYRVQQHLILTLFLCVVCKFNLYWAMIELQS